MVSKSVIFAIFLLFIASQCTVSGLELGDSCDYSADDTGVCKFIYECRRALADYKLGIPPVQCKSGEIIQIVCCPVDAPVTTTTSTTVRPHLQNKIGLRLSEQKCYEYSKFVYENVTIPSQLPGGAPIINEVDKCGFKVTPLIVGGEKAGAREFPHMALIGYGPLATLKFGCGGSVISVRYILTAGHCTITRDGAPTFVRLGDLIWDNDDDDARPQVIGIETSIPHPSYLPNLQYHDIALLRLQNNIVFDIYVRPACLNMDSAIPTRKAIATGWGAVKYYGPESSTLLKVILDFFTFPECRSKFPSKRKLPTGLHETEQVCAGSKDAKKDTCQGDSGGPLQIFHDDIHCMYNIVGITSFGKACGTIGTPGVYTRVSNYINWIEENAFSHG